MIELRWIERDVPMPSPYAGMSSKIKVLQYRQVFSSYEQGCQTRTDWQDVPTEIEGGSE